MCQKMHIIRKLKHMRSVINIFNQSKFVVCATYKCANISTKHNVFYMCDNVHIYNVCAEPQIVFSQLQIPFLFVLMLQPDQSVTTRSTADRKILPQEIFASFFKTSYTGDRSITMVKNLFEWCLDTVWRLIAFVIVETSNDYEGGLLFARFQLTVAL